jgi:hypothetical protein
VVSADAGGPYQRVRAAKADGWNVAAMAVPGAAPCVVNRIGLGGAATAAVGVVMPTMGPGSAAAAVDLRLVPGRAMLPRCC